MTYPSTPKVIPEEPRSAQERPGLRGPLGVQRSPGVVLGASGPHVGAPGVSFTSLFLLCRSLCSLVSSLFSSLVFLSSFSRLSYMLSFLPSVLSVSSLFSFLSSLLSSLVSLLSSLFSSVHPAARGLLRSELGSAAPQILVIRYFGVGRCFGTRHLFKNASHVPIQRPK